jgi:hypothetical protein
MAILEIHPDLIRSTEGRSTEGSPSVNVELHDASRIEWKISLPIQADAAFHYEIDFEVQIPTNSFVKHVPWDHFQSFARLDGGEQTDAHAATIDALRRSALGLAQTLKRKSEGFSRACRLAGSLFQSQARAFDVQELEELIAAATQCVETARKGLCAEHSGDPLDLMRERVLVDEYASVRLLDCLAGFGRALSSLKESRSIMALQFADSIEALDQSISHALESELTRRRTLGFVAPESGSMAALERYLERASQLKKHFQEVLFLEAETFQVAERIHHLVAGFVAVVASTWAFFWQIALAERAMNSGGKIGSGLLLFAVIAGVVYAGKDRIKEVGRNWISGRVHRHYAQRVAKFRAPKRSLSGGGLIATARESFDQKALSLPDPLNPSSSARLSATSVSYLQKGIVLPQPGLSRDGVSQIKYVFRYDLSPLFCRLDDALKQVPVLDETTGRVKFVDAPRCYRVPIMVRVRAASKEHVQKGNLVLHKRGLDRLEFLD